MFNGEAERSKTILLADDEYMVREMVKLLLESRGYTVISAEDGNDAINKFYNHDGHIDLLLFDVTMPGKNGEDAYDMIKKTKPDVKVLLMSGYAEDVLLKNDSRKDKLQFLQKPASPETLFSKINEVLNA